MARIDIEGLAVERDRLVVAPEVGEDVAEIAIAVGVGRIERNGAA